MLSVCYRYAKDLMEAEDVLQEVFIRVFDKIHQYNFKGSLEGWVRRVTVTTAINNYRANEKRYYHQDPDEAFPEGELVVEAESDVAHSADDLMRLVRALPEGYRNVFNLYAIDGYSHKEIATMLNISENTSKSQLSRARKVLQDSLKKSQLRYHESA